MTGQPKPPPGLEDLYRVADAVKAKLDELTAGQRCAGVVLVFNELGFCVRAKGHPKLSLPVLKQLVENLEAGEIQARKIITQ